MVTIEWVLQHRYSGCDIKYSGWDVRYSPCVFMKAVALISYILLWCHKYTLCYFIPIRVWRHKVWLWCHVECVWFYKCAKSDNILNWCDQSMHRVLQDRYSVCYVTYSVCDVRYSCVFMKAVVLISYILLWYNKYTVCDVIPIRVWCHNVFMWCHTYWLWCHT